MLIGVPKEIKTHEYRVGMTPGSVREAVRRGHQVHVETGAGLGIGSSDADYAKAGATIANSAKAVYEAAELIIKVKEPQPSECRMLHPGQVLFTYLHLAADKAQAELLRESGCTAIAYETVTDAQGGLPLLAPMSEVAGRMSIQVGACLLQKPSGGRGVLLGGVPGVAPAKVVVLGAGAAGSQAARVAASLGAQVVVLNRTLPKLRALDDHFLGRLQTVCSTTETIETALSGADLVIGAVLVPGASTPRLVGKSDLARMRRGAVIVDISIDQGGCFETSRPTTHQDPTYEVEGVIHYCVTNMPGAVPHTSTYALNNAILPFALVLADKGWKKACQDNPHLLAGLNVHAGQITCQAVAHALDMPYTSPAL
jgi:alanine dehydrogenase